MEFAVSRAPSRRHFISKVIDIWLVFANHKSTATAATKADDDVVMGSFVRKLAE